MKTITYTIENEYGLHARNAALLAQACVGMATQITVRYNGAAANGSNVLQVLALQAVKGAKIEITAEGGDEDAALETVVRALSEGMKNRLLLRAAYWAPIRKASGP